MTMSNEIGENLCFRHEQGNSQMCQQAYDYYKQHSPGSFDEWGYDNKTVIFLDTNIILKTYFLSKLEKNSIVKFIKSNKNRIVIASQVDIEYQKHRLKFISGYNKQLEKLAKDANAKIESCLKSLNGEAFEKINELSENHVLKYDFLGEFIDLNSIQDDIQAYFDCLKEDRDKIVKRLQEFQKHVCDELLPSASNVASMYLDDDLLQAIAQCKILSPLSENEMMFIKQKYADCLSIFEKNKTSEIGHYQSAFPGCGDKKKDENEDRFKESDMVIYHEMLKYMKESNTDVVFLTFDLKKGDWVPSKGYNEVFLHYIENQFAQTGHVVYVKSGDELPLLFETPPETNDEDTDNDEPDVVAHGSITLFDDSFSSDEECISSEDATSLENIHNETKRNEYKSHKSYRKIDAKRFLSELQTCSKWANEYGAGYVGRDYFIYGLLGKQKHFEFNQSRLVYKSLKDEGKIQEQTTEDGDEIIYLVDK